MTKKKKNCSITYTFYVEEHSPVAQLAEQQTVNLWVVGSSPTGGAKANSMLYMELAFFLILLLPYGIFDNNFLYVFAISCPPNGAVIIIDNTDRLKIILPELKPMDKGILPNAACTVDFGV